VAVFVNGKKREWVVEKPGYHILVAIGIELVVFFKRYEHKKKVNKWIADVWAEGDEDVSYEAEFDTWQQARKAAELELQRILGLVKVEV
jgi:hypothetical protein